MGRAEILCVLAIGVAGCGVTLGYGDDRELVDQSNDVAASDGGAVLDARIVNPSGSNDDPSVDVGGGGGGGGGANADASAEASAPSTPPPPPGPCASCPSGTAQSMCIANACTPVRRVFVSSTSSTANLGGASGADARCQSLANAANLGGTWRAWVSTSSSSPNGRFTKATVSYRLLDGSLVANDWNDLTSGSLRHAIDRDEKNVAAPGNEVWTATTAAGNFDSGGCNGFTSSSNGAPYAAQGVTNLTNDDWTTIYVQFCDRPNPRIYCFEQ